MLRILPLLNLRAFEKPKPVVVLANAAINVSPKLGAAFDTIIVPAQRDGFERVFLAEHAWYAIRISGAKLDKIKYCAGYQTSPVSAVTHVAQVKQIEPYGDSGKYRLVFAEAARPIAQVPLGNAAPGTMQGPRYTTYAKLAVARSVSELF